MESVKSCATNTMRVLSFFCKMVQLNCIIRTSADRHWTESNSDEMEPFWFCACHCRRCNCSEQRREGEQCRSILHSIWTASEKSESTWKWNQWIVLGGRRSSYRSCC